MHLIIVYQLFISGTIGAHWEAGEACIINEFFPSIQSHEGKGFAYLIIDWQYCNFAHGLELFYDCKIGIVYLERPLKKYK